MSVYKKDKLEYVKIAINSVLRQSLKPNQFVIMIDGPIEDDLRDMLLNYEKTEKIIELHFREENKGLGITLNEGLGFCNYSYVARMDADDNCHRDRFEKQIDYLTLHSDIDVIGCNIDEYDEKMQEKISTKFVPENNEQIYEYLKCRNPFNHMSVIYKKESVIEAGNYLDCQFFEDYYLWCRMATKKCKFYNIQESLMDVRGGLDMIKRRGGRNYNACILNFQKKILDLKIINLWTFYKNITIRILASSLPQKLRFKLYKNKLRGEK